MDSIVLIGFMGSGKTTLGRRLAAVLGIDCIDCDTELETASGCSIRTLIARHGESAFRAAELEVLRQLVDSRRADCIVATGGGIVESEEARALLPRLGRVVWLRADPEVCVDRLGAARATRPLLADADGWRARYARRVPLYAATAEWIVDTYPESVETSVGALLRCLGLALPPTPAGG